LHALAISGGPSTKLLLDNSHIKAHLLAADCNWVASFQPYGDHAAGRTTRIEVTAETTARKRGDAFVALVLMSTQPPRAGVIANTAYDSKGLRRFLIRLGK